MFSDASDIFPIYRKMWSKSKKEEDRGWPVSDSGRGFRRNQTEKKMVDQIIVFILFEFILISSSLKKNYSERRK